MMANIQGQLKQLNENITSLNTQVNDILIGLNTKTANNRKANETLQKMLDTMERWVDYCTARECCLTRQNLQCAL